MSDARGEEPLPLARVVRGRWPGLVWAIPLAALLIVLYLGVRAMTRHGVDVTVTFTRAESVSPGDTKVMVQGVEAGHVKAVRVAPDARHVEVTLSLDPRTKPALNTNTKFWLIGENPTITDIQSVRAAITGVIVAMAPGQGGTATRSFAGLDSPPAVEPGRAGTAYLLSTAALGSVQPGTSVLYHGQEIGKVQRTGLIGLDQFRVQVFIYAPFDQFVRDGAEFWTGSPLRFSLTGASLSAGLSSPSSVLQGSIEFDLPERARGNARLPAHHLFTLYPDQGSAEQGPPGPEVPYQLVLDGPAGDLGPQSRVTLLGYTVGRVRSAQLLFAPGSRKPYTLATIGLYPSKLDVVAGGDRSATDRAVAQLLMQGYRAGLAQSPPLVGPHSVVLARARGAAPAGLGRGPAYPLIPARPGSADPQDLLAQADQILAKVNQLPIAAIGAELRGTIANLRRLTGSPQLADSLAHLDATLTQLDAVSRAAGPRVGPLLAKLDQTATEVQGTAAAARALVSGEGAGQDASLPDAIRQLNEAARSIRSLTDYLGRHPEALLRGKTKEKP